MSSPSAQGPLVQGPSNSGQPKTGFDKSRHMIRVQGGREYLPVAARLVWFRQEHPDWGIVTQAVEINLERQYAIFSCTIFNAEGRVMATATKMENVKGFGDYIEKAETGSVGRALVICGYGTQGDLDDGMRFSGSQSSHNTPGGHSTPSARSNPVTSSPLPSLRASLVSGPPVEIPVEEEPACLKCDAPLTASEADSSRRDFGKALCRSCRATAPRPRAVPDKGQT